MITYASIRPDSYVGVYRFYNGNLENVTDGRSFEQHPIADPKNKALIFSGSENGSHHLFFLKDGMRTKLTDHLFFEDHARFDMRGNIYFCSDYAGAVDIYRAKWTGNQILMEQAEKLTDGIGNSFTFAISPCGEALVFSSNRDNRRDYDGPQPKDDYHAGQLYLMDLSQPSSCRRLLEGGGSHWEGSPEFSNDGKFLFFYSTKTENDQKDKSSPKIYRYDFETKKDKLMVKQDSIYPACTEDGRVLFSCLSKKKTWKIKSMNLDGSDLKTVAKSKTHLFAPRPHLDGSIYLFGPTGIKVDFVQEKGTSLSLPLTAIRGFFPVIEQEGIAHIENMQRVNRGEQFYSAPEGHFVFGLSKDFQGKLLTTVGVPFENSDSHIIRSDTGENLTEAYGPARNGHACPFGKDIVFSRMKPGEKKQLCKLTSDKIETLTKEEGEHQVFPTVWRHLIAYSSTPDKKSYSLKILNTESGQTEQLTKGFVDIHACFSPDGTHLLFTSDRGGLKTERPLCWFFNPQPYGDLYILNIATKEIRKLTSSPYEDSTPAWS